MVILVIQPRLTHLRGGHASLDSREGLDEEIYLAAAGNTVVGKISVELRN